MPRERSSSGSSYLSKFLGAFLRFLKRFWRVVGSYSIEEKVISLVLAGLVIVLTVQGAVNIFSMPETFVGEGGYYTEGLISEQSTLLNPVYADFSQANRDVSSLIFTGLTRYDPTVKAFVADLAELTISEDNKTYTFVLKDGVLWHDGELLTAEDVYFTYADVIQNPDFQNPVLKANFEGVEVKLIDDKTVEFVLNNPNSFFITNLSVGILPKHILENVPVADLPLDEFNFAPIGTGPYKVDSPLEALEDRQQRVWLSLNEDYYGTKPKIENIRFRIYPDSEFMKKEINTLNVISKVSKDVYEEIKDADRFEFLNYELPQYTAVFLNMDSPFLQKDKVRIALQKAIDKEKLLELLPGKTPVDTPLMALDQSEWLYKPNIEEAGGALFDSGYKMGDDETDPYRKNSEGESLKLVLLVRDLSENPVANEELKETVNFLVESWKQIGVEVESQYENPVRFEERIQTRDYDLLITGESLGYNFDTYAYWHSSQAGENGLNLSNYRSFAADSMIEKIRDTFDKDEKAEYLEKLAETFASDVPAIFLYRPSYVFATDSKVQGISLDNMAYPGDRFEGVGQWYIN
jgi:peptide/nickel transport system substrate-binding protein